MYCLIEHNSMCQSHLYYLSSSTALVCAILHSTSVLTIGLSLSDYFVYLLTIVARPDASKKSLLVELLIEKCYESWFHVSQTNT